MCCKNFGFGLIILSITLFLGITVSSFFVTGEILEKNISETSVIEVNDLPLNEVIELKDAKVKKCVPADKDLKYRNLPLDESDSSISSHKLPYPEPKNDYSGIPLDRLSGLRVQIELYKSALKELDKSEVEKAEKIQKKMKILEDEIDQMMKRVGEDPFIPQSENLIYLEKCLENIDSK